MDSISSTLVNSTPRHQELSKPPSGDFFGGCFGSISAQFFKLPYIRLKLALTAAHINPSYK